MDKQTPKAEGDPAPAKYKDLSLPELFDMFPNDRAVMEWFESNIWPDGRKCPRCGYKYTCTSRHPSMPYYCAECGKRFSVRAGTIMEHSKIGYRNWAIATYLQATRPMGISSVHLGRDLGIRQSSAWFLLYRLREAWRTLAGPEPMADSVGVDEVYLGGRQKSKHADKRDKRKKIAVVGIKDREAETIRAMPVPETTAARPVEFVESNITEDIQVFTDENRAYNGLDNHETANHGDGEYVRGKVHVNGMESFWALMGAGTTGRSVT